MAEMRPTLRELAAGLALPTGRRHKIIIPKLDVDTIEMDDLHFHDNSAVVLPWRSGEQGGLDEDDDRPSGLSVVAAALQYAKANSGKELMLAGHSDSSGQADDNRSLSKARAQATQALLKGDKDAWGRLCAAHQQVEDLQRTLVWVADTHGWPCDPGAVDNTMGPKTQAARRAFRQRYNDELSPRLALNAEETSADDWKAFFDLFELGLMDELGDDLPACRSALKFRSPDILACGEDFAQAGKQPTGMRSASDRRVDLLFLDPAKPYPDFLAESPPGKSIYGPVPPVKRRYLPVDPPVQLAVKLTAIEGLYTPGFAPDGDADPKLSGYQVGYTSDDDLGRIFVNHRPRVDSQQPWQDAVAKDTQYIELVASVELVQGAKIPSNARVQWEWFDPNSADHPETQNHAARLPDAVDVDGKVRSFLNRGTCDFPNPGSSDMARFGPADEFEFADGKTVKLSDTEIKDGVSRVRLHVSNVAGDNFVVTARLKNSPRIAPSGSARTGVMTVWKRIDVEYVRMENALPLPVDQVVPFFEPARVQMDFAPERVVPSRPFLAIEESAEDAACGRYASAAQGEFKNEGKPGWFFLAAAERLSSEGATGAGPAPIIYEGPATVEVDPAHDFWEKLVVDQVIDEEVGLVTMHDAAGGRQGFMEVARTELSGGKTHLHLKGTDYQSDFDVPRGENTGLVGGTGEGGAYAQTEIYLPRRRVRFPSGPWEPGGMGFGRKVFIQAKPRMIEKAGFSPDVWFGGKKYFAGRLLVFTHVHAKTTLDARIVSIIVHELTHAFGYAHKCGYYGWPQPPEFSCAMNYFLTWLYKSGTRKLDRFVSGTPSAHLCSKHLAGIREVHLEDNPVMWRWT